MTMTTTKDTIRYDDAIVRKFDRDPDRGSARGRDLAGRRRREVDERAAIARCASPTAADAPERGRHGHFRWHSS